PVTSSPSSRPSRHHTVTRSPAPVPSEPQLARRLFPTNPSRAHAGAWPESAIVAVGRVRTFSSNISLISSPNLSSEAPGVRLIHRRDLREVQLARTSSRRRTRETTRAVFLASDPPPKCRNSLGDSAEFSAEVGRKLIKEKGKKVICVRQLPGVGHAQESARFSKRKLGRVLSMSL
ncbi:hypothetical protein Prudu_719S000300, partial [Prunus dulcis]